jgi:hypothetical protein
MDAKQPWCEGCEVYPVTEYLAARTDELSPRVQEEVLATRALLRNCPCSHVLNPALERPKRCDYPLEAQTKVTLRGALHALAIRRNTSDSPPNIGVLIDEARNEPADRVLVPA